MSARAALLVRSFPVGKYRCELTFPPMERGEILSMAAEWTPCLPDQLTVTEMRAYRAGRDAAAAELSELVGFDVLALG